MFVCDFVFDSVFWFSLFLCLVRLERIFPIPNLLEWCFGKWFRFRLRRKCRERIARQLRQVSCTCTDVYWRLLPKTLSKALSSMTFFLKLFLNLAAEKENVTKLRWSDYQFSPALITFLHRFPSLRTSHSFFLNIFPETIQTHCSRTIFTIAKNQDFEFIHKNKYTKWKKHRLSSNCLAGDSTRSCQRLWFNQINN